MLSRARGGADVRHDAMVSVDVLHDASLLQVEGNKCGLGLPAPLGPPSHFLSFT